MENFDTIDWIIYFSCAFLFSLIPIVYGIRDKMKCKPSPNKEHLWVSNGKSKFCTRNGAHSHYEFFRCDYCGEEKQENVN